MQEANRPIAGSTPAMIEKEIASGISASATTRPASASVRSTFGDSQEGRKERGRAGAETVESGKTGRPVGRAHRRRAGERTGEGDGPPRYRRRGRADHRPWAHGSSRPGQAELKRAEPVVRHTEEKGGREGVGRSRPPKELFSRD
ncbi:hypothetical protein GCM10010275_40230 [Streptomyces litmocidini]|nr:hypothetical protein GCM10010275_40230 [Streptomyces litmocidini]